MNSNRFCMHKALSVLAIVTVIVGIYVLAKTQILTDLALADRDEEKQNERLTKLTLLCSTISGTILDVEGRFVAPEEANNPRTLRFTYLNGHPIVGLAHGKTVIIRGELREGLFDGDNITITGGTFCSTTDTPSQPLGLIDHMIFFMACRISELL